MERNPQKDGRSNLRHTGLNSNGPKGGRELRANITIMSQQQSFYEITDAVPKLCAANSLLRKKANML